MATFPQARVCPYATRTDRVTSTEQQTGTCDEQTPADATEASGPGYTIAAWPTR